MNVTARFLLLFLYWIATSSAEEEVDELYDLLDDCSEKVLQGQCMTHRVEMDTRCNKSCTEWREKKMKYKVAQFEDEGEFFDLESISVHGHTVSYEKFEGYLTVVMSIAKTCSNSKVDPETLFSAIEHLQQTWPYSLEIIVFPIEHPSVDYSKQNCSKFDEAMKKFERSIHVMEMTELNGPNTNPVYKFLKQKFDVKDIDLNTLTYFLINPDGNWVQMHFQKSLEDLKLYISESMHELEL